MCPGRPGLSKIVQKSWKIQKKCFQTKCIQNSSFQMCAQSSQGHFGQGKTLQNPQNPGFLRDPEKSENPKKSKNSPLLGVAYSPIEP